jgi:hypothetical protein
MAQAARTASGAMSPRAILAEASSFTRWHTRPVSWRGAWSRPCPARRRSAARTWVGPAAMGRSPRTRRSEQCLRRGIGRHRDGGGAVADCGSVGVCGGSSHPVRHQPRQSRADAAHGVWVDGVRDGSRGEWLGLSSVGNSSGQACGRRASISARSIGPRVTNSTHAVDDLDRIDHLARGRDQPQTDGLFRGPRCGLGPGASRAHRNRVVQLGGQVQTDHIPFSQSFPRRSVTS